MKRLFVGLVAIGLLVGCNANNGDSKEGAKSVAKSNKTEDATKVEEKQEDSKYPFPTTAATGDAKITISTPAGDSSNGNVPVLFVTPDDVLIQIGADFENFQGDKQTFVYIDKIFEYADQYGELSQSSLDLSENRLDIGVHTVTAVQFEGDDPTAAVINLVEAKYEVKEGK